MPSSIFHGEAPAPRQASARSMVDPSATPRFIIGRDGHGGWVVQDRLGRIGGLFASETAALHFAREECDRNPLDVCRAPEGVVLGLDTVTADRPH